MLIKQTSLLLPRNLALGRFDELLIVFSTKINKSAITPLFNGTKVLSSASDKAKSFAKNLTRNSNLDDSGISLPVFSSRSNMKLRNISVTPKLVKKVITDLVLSKASGPDCSYIPAKLFNTCLKECSFPDC